MSFFNRLFGSSTQTTNTIKILDKNSYKKAISKKGIQLVDVRTTNEYKNGHISNAENIDFFKQGIFVNAFEKFDKTQPIYLYCQSGNRSQKAARKLVKLGFEKIYDLKGGYTNWR